MWRWLIRTCDKFNLAGFLSPEKEKSNQKLPSIYSLPRRCQPWKLLQCFPNSLLPQGHLQAALLGAPVLLSLPLLDHCRWVSCNFLHIYIHTCVFTTILFLFLRSLAFMFIYTLKRCKKENNFLIQIFFNSMKYLWIMMLNSV